ncbi:hypothetical protein [Stratiformator vulcanicus]|nr:hypothetical protein [Stratiformator vulcanicus]
MQGNEMVDLKGSSLLHQLIYLFTSLEVGSIGSALMAKEFDDQFFRSISTGPAAIPILTDALRMVWLSLIMSGMFIPFAILALVATAMYSEWSTHRDCGNWPLFTAILLFGIWPIWMYAASPILFTRH